jgi:hypothetical protein
VQTVKAIGPTRHASRLTLSRAQQGASCAVREGVLGIVAMDEAHEPAGAWPKATLVSTG